ncbi:MAG: anthranilate synthase component I [Ignavibacteriales bacterium]
MFYPSFQEVKELAKDYNVIPVSMQVYADTETPISLFKRFGGPDSFLLESVEGGEKWARYSFIGRNPYMKVIGIDSQVRVEENNQFKTFDKNPIEVLKEKIKEYKAPKIKNIPRFSGGAVGFIGYDIVRFYEELPAVKENDINIPDFQFMLTDEIIAYDHLSQKIHIIVNLHVNEQLEREYFSVTHRIKEIYSEIKDSRSKLEPEVRSKVVKEEIILKGIVTKDEYCKGVEKAKEHIKNGDIFQVVLSQRFEIETKQEPLNIYRALRIINPSPYMYFLNFDNYSIIGSSPERLVRVEDGIVETCPIAGTRRRGIDEVEDRRLEKELLQDEKERAEHTMLVDLGRNDVGKVSKFGTVKVKNLMHIERYSHVMHIVTDVEGQLRQDKDCFDALAGIMPAGTLSGAPKVMAMTIIDTIEKSKRGPYGGAVGYIGFDGTMDTCITIRTLVYKQGKAYLQAGAGIVADSVPEKEYEECLKKAEALIKAVKEAGEIL